VFEDGFEGRDIGGLGAVSVGDEGVFDVVVFLLVEAEVDVEDLVSSGLP